jgi:hypothetical protein
MVDGNSEATEPGGRDRFCISAIKPGHAPRRPAADAADDLTHSQAPSSLGPVLRAPASDRTRGCVSVRRFAGRHDPRGLGHLLLPLW